MRPLGQLARSTHTWRSGENAKQKQKLRARNFTSVPLQWHLFGGRGGEAQDEARKTSAARRVLEERKRPVLKTQWSQRQSYRGDACENGYGSGDVPTKEC